MDGAGTSSNWGKQTLDRACIAGDGRGDEKGAKWSRQQTNTWKEDEKKQTTSRTKDPYGRRCFN
jgi:hypothetical protein